MEGGEANATGRWAGAQYADGGVHAVHRAELKASEQRAARLEKALASAREEGRATAARDRDRRAAAEAEKVAAEEQLAVAGARVRELESRLSAADHGCYQVCCEHSC